MTVVRYREFDAGTRPAPLDLASLIRDQGQQTAISDPSRFPDIVDTSPTAIHRLESFDFVVRTAGSTCTFVEAKWRPHSHHSWVLAHYDQPRVTAAVIRTLEAWKNTHVNITGSFLISCLVSASTTSFDAWASTIAAERLVDWLSLPNPESDPFSDYDQYQTSNWDGYDAEPITSETVQAARTLLGWIPRTVAKPEIAPGADGGIGFEWLLRDGPIRKLFIDIGPGPTWSAYWRRSSGETGNVPRQPISETKPAQVAELFGELGLTNDPLRR